MKKAVSVLIISVFLLMSACSVGSVPKFSLCEKFSGTVSVGESKFEIDADFSDDNPVIIVNNSKNVFNSRYEFSDESVKIKYDEIESIVEISDLSKGNIPLTIYRIYNCLKDKRSVTWSKEKGYDNWYFKGTCSGISFSGKCDKEGKILSFSVPDTSVEFKIKNFG